MHPNHPIPMRILSSASAIQGEVRRLMRPGARRVALTAFVGNGAAMYVPDPVGVTIVCWPKAGGTNPRAVRELIDRGANVLFSDRLHMKVFWAERRGALVGSANLTTNALGAGNLKELMVALPANAVPIEALLKQCDARSVSADELRQLDRDHDRLGAKWHGTKQSAMSFRSWFDAPHRPKWKLGWWDERVPFSKASVARARLEYNRDPVDSICGQKRDYREGDWILSFGLTAKKAKEPCWIFTNFIVQTTASTKAKYPIDAVQTYTSRERTTPPFTLDKRFRKSFDRACRRYGVAKIKSSKDVTPPQDLLRLIAEEFTDGSLK